MSKSYYYSKNKNLFLFKSYFKSKFRSLKYDNYFHIYEDLLKKYKNKKITFVEIGVANGGSLFMWRSFFGKKARIIGIDFNPTAKKWEKYGFEIFIGNQAHSIFWNFFFDKVGKVDIIIDDGGHTNDQMIKTFHYCSSGINNGGLLVFEDTHASYLQEFGNPSRFSFINFCYSVANKINNSFFNKKFNYNYQKLIYKVEFYQSLVAFHIDKLKTYRANPIDNNGIILNSEDFRLKDKKIFLLIDKHKKSIQKYLPSYIYIFLKKIYPIFKFFLFKINIKKNKPYFY
jgi:hypothetical protein